MPKINKQYLPDKNSPSFCFLSFVLAVLSCSSRRLWYSRFSLAKRLRPKSLYQDTQR